MRSTNPASKAKGLKGNYGRDDGDQKAGSKLDPMHIDGIASPLPVPIGTHHGTRQSGTPRNVHSVPGVEVASLAFFGVAKRSSAIFVVLTSDRAHLLMSSDGAHFAAFFPALLAASASPYPSSILLARTQGIAFRAPS